jgi:hypothetical protein
LQLFNIAAASEDRALAVLVPQQGEKQMLQADIFMPAGFGLFKGGIQGY